MSEFPGMRNGGSAEFQAAYERGRRAGLGVAAVAMSLVAFISLLGLEKAILAGVLGVVAMQESGGGTPGRRLGLAALVIAVVYVVNFVIVMAVFHERLAELARLLQRMS